MGGGIFVSKFLNVCPMNSTVTKVSVLMAIMLMLNCLICRAQDQDRNPNWIFFQNIPTYKSVVIKDSDWSLSINDAYQVHFEAVKQSSYHVSEESWSKKATYEGVGVLKWDNGGLKVEMTVNSSGEYRFSREIYETRRERIAGSGVINFLIDGSGADYRTYREYVGTERKYASGENTEKVSLDLNVSESNCSLSSMSLSVSISGDVYETLKLDIPKSTRSMTIEKKSDSEQAASLDQFGLWQWNNDRSKIYLQAVGGAENFVIWNKDGILSWSLELGNEALGISEAATEQGDIIVTLSVSLDGSSPRNLTFAKFNPKSELKVIEVMRDTIVPVSAGDSTSLVRQVVKSTKEELMYNENDKFFIDNMTQGSTLLNYAVYNRFLGSLDMRSEALLTEFKNYRIMLVNYKVGDIDKSALFRLDGLESLMDYL